MVDKRRKVLLGMIISGGVLMILAGLAWVILNALTGEAHIPTPVSATPGSVAEVSRVTAADAKNALDAGAAVFVDVRDSASYEKSHVPGALLIPLSDLEDHLKELDKDSWIITYCT